MITWPEVQPILRDGELTLRTWQGDDADEVFAICQDADIAEFQTLNVPFTTEDAQRFVTGNDESFKNQRVVAYAGEVDGKVALSAVLHSANKFDHVIEIGYWVAPEFRGRGLGTRAITLLTQLAFDMGFRRVQAICDEVNRGSIALLEKAGFEYETRLRNGLTRRNDEQTDALLYAKFPG